MLAYKCTRADGTDFYTGTISYADALKSGEPLIHPDPERSSNPCGRGWHCSDTPILTCLFGRPCFRPWRWFELEILEENILGQDKEKKRVSRIERVVRELSYADVFGQTLAKAVKGVRAEAKTWKAIPWLKPPAPVDDATIKDLFHRWHAAISPWLKPNQKLPRKLKIVRTAAEAVAAEAEEAEVAAAEVAAAEAEVAAAAAEGAAAAAAEEAEVAAAAAEVAEVAVAAAAAAAEVAEVAEAETLRYRYWWRWWYVRPYYVLRRQARWILAGRKGDSVWGPLIEMFRLGCLPTGYSQGRFVVYVPEVKA